MSSRELREEILTVPEKSKKGYAKPAGKTNTIMSNVTPELLELLEKMRRGKM